jgi:hypothetical protein
MSSVAKLDDCFIGAGWMKALAYSAFYSTMKLHNKKTEI